MYKKHSHGIHLAHKKDFPTAFLDGDEKDEYVVLLGDVGGTNIRLVLARIYMSGKDKLTVQEKTIDSRSVQSFEEAVKSFLKVSITFLIKCSGV